MDERQQVLRFGRTEGRVLAVLWRIGCGSSQAIVQEIGDAAYSERSVGAALDKLLSKYLVKRQWDSGRRVYSPTLSRPDFIRAVLEQLGEFLQEGDGSWMVPYTPALSCKPPRERDGRSRRSRTASTSVISLSSDTSKLPESLS